MKQSIYLAVSWLLLAASNLAFQSPRTLTLSGKVLLEDGTPPTSPVTVEFVCNSRIIQVARIRPEGSFHFRLGEQRRPDELSAATSGPDTLEIGGRGLGGLRAGGGLRESGDGRFDLTNCEIRLPPHPGWEADKITLGVVSVFEQDVGVIVLRKLADVQGTTISVTTLEAPEPAAEAFRRARRELDKKKPNYRRAAKRLEDAVALYPRFAEAWNLLGEARLGLGDREGAQEALQRSVSADPDFILPYLTLAGLELEKFHYREALSFTSELVKLDPFNNRGHYYHGLAHYSLGEFDAAMESFRVIEKQGAQAAYPASVLMLGDILARKGEVKAAAERLRRYLEIGQHTPEMGQQLREQLREWEERGLIEKPSPKN